jgi:nucleotide-binding universal stress UspA family protein
MSAEYDFSNPKALLVAMDFSPSARRALDLALSWHGSTEVTLLHVIDTDFAERVEAAGLAERAEVVLKLREGATQELGWLKQEKSTTPFSTMVVEGSPFVEIVKIANDLAVDMIAMGMRRAPASVDQVLFGSTAEKVLRASSCPVVCVP